MPLLAPENPELTGWIITMNTNNFKIFVEALEALPDEIKNNEVDMNSTLKPACGTPGCFGGLISVFR
jgi:hypothetical protein